MAYEYVQKVVHRYRKQISVWNVVSGLHTNSAFTLNFEQIIELNLTESESAALKKSSGTVKDLVDAMATLKATPAS